MTICNEGATLVAVRAAASGARVFLDVESAEGRESFCVLTARLSRLPVPGALTAEQFAFLRKEAELTKAVESGLRSLGSCGSSERHLAEKLRARGISPKTAAEASAFLRAQGLLRENEGAVRTAERDLQKLWGNRRILADLTQKGYDKEALAAARERLAREEETTRCCHLIGKLQRSGKDAAAIARTLAHFGYPTHLVDAFRRVSEEK